MPVTLRGGPVPREWCARDARAVAADLIGARLSFTSAEGMVSVLLTEVEAYLGVGEDPGSHAHRGRTPRTAVMFGAPGHLYVYFSYGVHSLVNIVTGPSGQASAVLLRSGEVVAGEELVGARQPHLRPRDWARGPGRLTRALGIGMGENGADVFADSRFQLDLLPGAYPILRSPRTGVAGPGGSDTYDWRFVAAGPDGRARPSVSPYRRHPRAS